MTQYDIIERAILFISCNANAQPSLDEVAAHVELSPYHLQRIFQEWAGVSPKKFLQSITIERAKLLLQQNRSLLETSIEIGLSGPSRLHDLFISIEAMTPGEFKSGARDLLIRYSFYDTLFGLSIVASTDKGVCFLAFCEAASAGLASLKTRFPNAQLQQRHEEFQVTAVNRITTGNQASSLSLHIKGTPFQLKVWQALLQLPVGSLATYSDVASYLDMPHAMRAVGNAVGANPIAYIIPCHRVIRSSGALGAYRWGSERKQAMLGWEAARTA